MTIIIEGQPVSRLPDSVHKLFEKYSCLKTEASKFVTKSVQVVRNPENVLYVTQKEYAIVKRGDKKISILGSDDATTCHIVILVNRKDSSLCLAHIDSANNLQSLTSMVVEVLGLSTVESACLELYIFGGYYDEKDRSETLTLQLLDFYQKLPVKVELKSMCVGIANTRHSEGINWPIIYGIAVNFHTNFEINPAKFNLNVRGPHLALRSARLFCDEECLYRVYNSADGVFIIEPFNYRFPPQRVAELLQMSDDYICKNFSTSPAVEPPHFSQEVKQTFQFVVQNPIPMLGIFKCNKPIKYSLSPDGEWQEFE